MLEFLSCFPEIMRVILTGNHKCFSNDKEFSFLLQVLRLFACVRYSSVTTIGKHFWLTLCYISSFVSNCFQVSTIRISCTHSCSQSLFLRPAALISQFIPQQFCIKHCRYSCFSWISYTFVSIAYTCRSPRLSQLYCSSPRRCLSHASLRLTLLSGSQKYFDLHNSGVAYCKH